MRPTRRTILISAVAMMFLSSCAEPDHRDLGPELSELPSGVLGALSVGPQTMKSLSKVDTSTAFVFGQDGELQGKVSGKAIYAGQSLLSRESLTTSSSQRATTLTPVGSDEAEIGYENIVQAGTVDPESGAAAMWFNSGVVDGIYSNRFVSRFPSTGMHSGFMPGITRLVGHCGDRIYALAQEAYIGTTGVPTENTFYEIAAGGNPVIIHTWDFPEEFLPASRNAVCSEDGSSLLALYASAESRKDEAGGEGLILVRINVDDGSRTQTPLKMDGIAEDIRRGTMYVSDGRLYWATGEGKVLSADLDSDAPHATVDWVLPDEMIGFATSTESGQLVILSKETSWGIESFDITSGHVMADRISLSWLDSVLGATTESGKSTYGVTDLAYLP